MIDESSQIMMRSKASNSLIEQQQKSEKMAKDDIEIEKELKLMKKRNFRRFTGGPTSPTLKS